MPVVFPMPKREIVIGRVWKEEVDPEGYIISIQTFSDDARRWIVEQAPKFGQLGPSLIHGLLDKLLLDKETNENLMTVEHLELIIEKCYDPKDVVKYLIEGYADENS